MNKPLLPSIVRVALLAALLGTAGCDDPAGPSTEGLTTTAAAAIQSLESADLILDDVQLRPGVTADINVRIRRNEAQACSDPARTALLIHGVNHTAATWDHLVDAFFEGPAPGQFCRTIAVDHAGHGGSGLPVGMTFGELAIEDYARTVIEVLDGLRARGIRPGILMGHSQGTSTLQTVQQMLVDGGSSLRDRFGVRDVVLLATQGPMELPVDFLLDPAALQELVGSLITTTPERGTYVQGPPAIFQSLWFVDLQLQPSSGTPSLETIAEEGWWAHAPLVAVLQATGQLGFATPSVSAGAFHSSLGTRLHVVDFADDPWSLSDRAGEIYEYLTGDPSGSGFVSLTDPLGEAVHDYTITHPSAVRQAIPLPRTGAERSAGHP
ncbi:MAG TPA: hypothetical protein VK858_14660 [Longimicrobiales bacterium]|nr:hypothetical protein [Longimicrobiales bacterium]